MKAIIWSKDNCTYCSQAKKILTLNNFDVEVRHLDRHTWTKEQLLKAVPNARTVPQIFINDYYIGGYNEMIKYLADNKINQE